MFSRLDVKNSNGIIASNIKQIYNGSRECLVLTQQNQLFEVIQEQGLGNNLDTVIQAVNYDLHGYKLQLISDKVKKINGNYSCCYYINEDTDLYVRLYDNNLGGGFPNPIPFRFVQSNVDIAVCADDESAQDVYFVNLNDVYKVFLNGEKYETKKIYQHVRKIYQIAKPERIIHFGYSWKFIFDR